MIVFRLTDGVMHVLSSINFLLRDPRFGFPATSLGDPIVTTTEFKGKTFFVFDIVNVFRVDESEPEFALDAIYPP